MMKNRACFAALTFALAGTAVGGQHGVGGPKVKFTAPPKAIRTDGKVRIEFAVNQSTDVMVAIEDGTGRVVRHLAAGVLGANAPEPLAKDSLKQSLVWDGTDDLGQPLPRGPYHVRVGAGLSVQYAGMMFDSHHGPNSIVNVAGLAARPDGRLYVFGNRWTRYAWQDTAVAVYRRDGSYERTIKPFPSSLAPERVAALGGFKPEGGAITPIIHRVLGTTYYPFEDFGHQQMGVTRNGRLILATVEPALSAIYRGYSAHLAALDPDGGVAYAAYAGPQLRKKWAFDRPCLAVGSDDRTVYLVGLGPQHWVRNHGMMGSIAPAVLKVALPQLGPAVVFFGDPATPGNDAGHLDQPRGIVCDGKRHLLVADTGNDRVVVLDEQSAKLLAAFPVKAPEWVGVNPRTDEVFVHTENHVAKFSGWRRPRQTASISLAWASEGLKIYEKEKLRLSFALDASADPPVLWIGRNVGPAPLRRCEDLGDHFSDLRSADAFDAPYLWNLSVDPTRRWVACRVAPGKLEIVNEATDEAHRVGVASGRASVCRLGPNGAIYGLHHWSKTGLLRFDRKGKAIPFPATLKDPDKQRRGRLRNRPSGTTAWERDFTVDRRGNIYVKNRGDVYHGLMTVDEYGPDGAFKRTAIWLTCDGSLGPRLDPRGNLYMGECIKPVGKPYPDIFDGRLSKFTQREYTWMYGSLVKYGPKGGAAWFPRDYDRNKHISLPYPFQDKPKLDPTLPRVTVSGNRGPYMTRHPFDVQGALWWRFGFAYLLDMAGSGTVRCHCTACDFDVDDFGRVFYPDQGRFRIEVLDTNGNPILHFGCYGNQDYCGPDSYVVDPRTKQLRPPKADDPADIEKPFASPEIAFNWFVGLAVSDRYVYVADGSNRRVLRVKMAYAADATCPITP